ncbi:hypothetical protein Pcinc_029924 [Petrolisthes cinctipes]|uniref:Thioredoxin domain-containing protein n=1 Tax=Petrolisthes cinctipes TaxID=88211 RepID=A0AAE1F032_PETCI|nr:hypothetical protein Pcinc_029924 [Petrolisthes cinctipes]
MSKGKGRDKGGQGQGQDKRSCKDCDKVLAELENIDDDTDRFGVQFVKVVDKKLAKSYGIKTFPALSFFRNKEPIHYEGDLMDEGGVLEFLTSLEAMELPDQIEDVNAKILDKIVEEQEFVAVLFYKTECRKCMKALQELENVDDDADQLGIAFVKINDPDLADEYSLGSLPALVYYRRRIPVVYDGDLMNEDKVLEWLVENKNTGDDDDVIDDVTLGLLNSLIDSLDHLAVIFYDRDETDDTHILTELENIDDELDSQGIHIVKIADDVAAREYGIEDTPCLVYFEKEIPSLYDGNLHNEEEVLAWLVEQLHSDEIEDITDEMLDKLIKESHHLAVLFYDEDEQESQHVVAELENIDDECDNKGVAFVKIDNDDEAKEYGIDHRPTLVYFEKGTPYVYSGNLLAEDEVLDWLVHQVEEDEIEDVTDEMLDRLIDRTEHLAVLFYDKDSRRSRKVLSELENIDDECDGRGIFFVKIDNYEEAKEYGIDNIPTLVYFESEIPYIFEGDLMKEEDVLSWLFHHVDHEEIADVTDEMLDKLIANEPHLAVLFYDKKDDEDHEVLSELENIDDDCEQAGVPFVKIYDAAEAKEYGIDDLPTLVYFENRIPSIYEGDLSNEHEVLAWLLQQKTSDTIEEVNDEILDDLIANFEYVAVYFSGSCEEGQKCDKVLDELENIDDDTDDHGMHFVTTEETGLAHEHGIKSFPTIALFRNGEPVIYKGDISNEDAVLKWLTSDETLQIPNQIEEVNQRMLERILNTSANVAVFFYEEEDVKSRAILTELEHIDDDCDDIGIDFVKISDEGIAQEYDIVSLPALVYFRSKFPQIYEGDLKDEEALLEWLIDNKDVGPASIIEEVDGKMLQNLVDTFEYLVVYFYDDNCPSCETILAELETIDDETDEVGIQFVKTNDVDVAEDLGISHLPALVYFEGGVPSIYDEMISNPMVTLNSRSLLGVREEGEGEGEEGELKEEEEEEEDDNEDEEDDGEEDDNKIDDDDEEEDEDSEEEDNKGGDEGELDSDGVDDDDEDSEEDEEEAGGDDEDDSEDDDNEKEGNEEEDEEDDDEEEEAEEDGRDDDDDEADNDDDETDNDNEAEADDDGDTQENSNEDDDDVEDDDIEAKSEEAGSEENEAPSDDDEDDDDDEELEENNDDDDEEIDEDDDNDNKEIDDDDDDDEDEIHDDDDEIENDDNDEEMEDDDEEIDDNDSEEIGDVNDGNKEIEDDDDEEIEDDDNDIEDIEDEDDDEEEIEDDGDKVEDENDNEIEDEVDDDDGDDIEDDDDEIESDNDDAKEETKDDDDSEEIVDEEEEEEIEDDGEELEDDDDEIEEETEKEDEDDNDDDETEDEDDDDDDEIEDEDDDDEDETEDEDQEENEGEEENKTMTVKDDGSNQINDRRTPRAIN